MKALMQTAKERGISFFEAEVLVTNNAMLSLVKKLDFSIESVANNNEIVRVVKDLR
jgi:acetyltransferase